MKKINLRKKKGFTLIELIIVVAILGILAAIAIPKFGNAQKDAKVSADKANAKIVSGAVAMALTKKDTIAISDVTAELAAVPSPQSMDGEFATTLSGNIIVYIHSSSNYYEVYPEYKTTAESTNPDATDIK